MNEVALLQITMRAMQLLALDEWTNYMTTAVMTSARLWVISRQWHPLFVAAPTAIGASARMPTTEEVRFARGTDRVAVAFQYVPLPPLGKGKYVLLSCGPGSHADPRGPQV